MELIHHLIHREKASEMISIPLVVLNLLKVAAEMAAGVENQ